MLKREYKEGEKILINILKEAQDKHGYLSEKVMKKLSLDNDIPLSRLYGVATFYMMLKTEKQGKFVIEICSSPSCVLNGVITVEDALKKELKVDVGETTKDGKFSLYKTSCIGCCDEAPAMLVNGAPYTLLTVKKIKDIIKRLKNADP